MHKSQSFKIGSSQRLPDVKRGSINVPGPGNYAISFVTKETAPRFGFGSSSRDQSNSKTQLMPGPGQYQAPQRIGKEGHSPSLHKKLSYCGIMNTTNNSPGPGAYAIHLNNKKKAPAYKLGSEMRDKSASPGKH